MKKLEKIKKYLHDYNDNWWNNERKDLDLKYYITTDLICDTLKEIEIDDMGLSDDELMEYYDNNYKKVYSGNTYNCNYRVQNDFCFHEYDVDDGFVVLIAFHISGDIRANYTEFIVVKVDYKEEIFELLLNNCMSNFDFEVDGVKYDVGVLMYEELSLYDYESEDYYMVVAYDDEELISEIRKTRKEIEEKNIKGGN